MRYSQSPPGDNVPCYSIEVKAADIDWSTVKNTVRPNLALNPLADEFVPASTKFERQWEEDYNVDWPAKEKRAIRRTRMPKKYDDYYVKGRSTFPSAQTRSIRKIVERPARVFVRWRNPVVEEGRIASFRVVSVSFGSRVSNLSWEFVNSFLPTDVVSTRRLAESRRPICWLSTRQVKTYGQHTPNTGTYHWHYAPPALSAHAHIRTQYT